MNNKTINDFIKTTHQLLGHDPIYESLRDNKVVFKEDELLRSLQSQINRWIYQKEQSIKDSTNKDEINRMIGMVVAYQRTLYEIFRSWPIEGIENIPDFTIKEDIKWIR